MEHKGKGTLTTEGGGAGREHLATNNCPNTNAYLAVVLDILFPAQRRTA